MNSELNDWFFTECDPYGDDGDCINDIDYSEKIEGLDY